MKAWNLISLTEARRLAVEALAAAPRPTEEVGLRQALGRIAACEMVSAEDNPSFDRSTVDGYAVRSEDLAAASLACEGHFGAPDPNPIKGNNGGNP